MKVVAIIQARMGSTRLPNKVLADVNGQPMLRILINRLKHAPELDAIVIATTNNPHDDVLEDWSKKEGIPCFRGSENDVLDRFYACAKKYQADVIVRITADDPLKDSGIIGQLVTHLIQNASLDYYSNTIKPSYPEGLDIEVFRFSALTLAHKQAKSLSEREHVTPYIWKNPHIFSLENLEFERDLSHWRWTVDKPEDLAFIRAIWSQFSDKPNTSFLEIIAYIDENPKLMAINAFKTIRNEGYLNSLKLEKK
jgi:spore coat polysaccharide biosynthesis protein SpsF